MRIFQNSGIYRSYRRRLTRLTRDCDTFAAAIDAFLADRFGAAHFLQPILQREEAAFFANGDDEFAQRLWAKEHGMPSNTTLADILRGQIEEHRSDVFYNMDPMRYGDEFLAKLPGSVRRKIAWRAAPSAGGRYLTHDIIVNNFPTLLDHYRAQGARTAYFAPAHDPAMDAYADRIERPIDVLFVGTYSQYHRQRAAMLEAVAALRDINVVMHLDRSRLTILAETPIGIVWPFRKHRRAKDVRMVAKGPVFGLELIDALSQAKIVVNGAIDMSLQDRGNMRVWEAMGTCAALVSDAGRYPEHLRAGQEFESYATQEELLVKISNLLADDPRRRELAKSGFRAVSTHYSKASQWEAFMRLAA